MTLLEKALNDYSTSSVYLLKDFKNYSTYLHVDLSEKNNLFSGIENSIAFEKKLNTFLFENNKLVAYGGYNEIRSIYKRSSHFNSINSLEERNIHLGIDLWATVNTPVIAPIEGVIHSFKNNTAFGDYGPTIILEHCINNISFFTLYGHLSLNSISKINIGDKILVGEVIGYLGDHTVNGDYAPHLHFQIIHNMEGNKGDFKGVTSLRDRLKDLKNCPDPNLLLKIDL
jgi:murein DD-endopeptidase MepM/ murein hydrolase activator NlpD